MRAGGLDANRPAQPGLPQTSVLVVVLEDTRISISASGKSRESAACLERLLLLLRSQQRPRTFGRTVTARGAGTRDSQGSRHAGAHPAAPPVAGLGAAAGKRARVGGMSVAPGNQGRSNSDWARRAESTVRCPRGGPPGAGGARGNFLCSCPTTCEVFPGRLYFVMRSGKGQGLRPVLGARGLVHSRLPWQFSVTKINDNREVRGCRSSMHRIPTLHFLRK